MHGLEILALGQRYADLFNTVAVCVQKKDFDLAATDPFH